MKAKSGSWLLAETGGSAFRREEKKVLRTFHTAGLTLSYTNLPNLDADTYRKLTLAYSQKPVANTRKLFLPILPFLKAHGQLNGLVSIHHSTRAA